MKDCKAKKRFGQENKGNAEHPGHEQWGAGQRCPVTAQGTGDVKAARFGLGFLK